MIKANQFNIRKRKYKNAVSFKFDNRRLTVVQQESGGYYFEFRIATKQKGRLTYHKRLKNKVTLTGIQLTQEASEIIMFSLAEYLGYEIVEKMNLK